MSKKFIVESIHDVPCEDIRNALDLRLGSCHHWTVTEFPIVPEVKKIETGALMSPAEITGCDYVDTITWAHKGESMQLCNGSSDIGKRLNIYTSYYPHAFYRDIETTWDFNSIPVGSLIEIVHNYGEKSHGLFQGVEDGNIHFDWVLSIYTIKSIRIVELGESK